MINDHEALRDIVRDAVSPLVQVQKEQAARLAEIERRVDRLHISVHGDPTVRSGPPSLFEMVSRLEKRVMERIDESDKQTARQIATLGGVVRRHDEFITARMKVETTIFKLGGRLFKLAGTAGSYTLVKAVISVIGGSAIGLIVSALTGLL